MVKEYHVKSLPCGTEYEQRGCRGGRDAMGLEKYDQHAVVQQLTPIFASGSEPLSAAGELSLNAEIGEDV